MPKFAVIVALFFNLFLCFVAVTAEQPSRDDLCPSAEGQPIADTLVTSYLSVDGGGILQCDMKYKVPAHATVYQGMLAASQQHNNFKFNSTVHPMYGHFITTINNVASLGGFYWFIFDGATKMLTPVGVDFIEVKNGSSYIWNYSNSTEHNGTTYAGPCDGSSFIAPTMPLLYEVVYLTVSGANIGQTTYATFKSVCSQPVLFAPGSTDVFRLMEVANSQIPISVQAVLNSQDRSVTSINGVPNSASYRWNGYKAGMQIPYDLSLTNVTNGVQIEFKYEEMVTDPRNGAPSAGRGVALLMLAALLANVVAPL